MVMIQKSGAIVKAYNGEQSPLFVELRGADDFFQPLSILSRSICGCGLPPSEHEVLFRRRTIVETLMRSFMAAKVSVCA